MLWITSNLKLNHFIKPQVGLTANVGAAANLNNEKSVKEFSFEVLSPV